MLNFDGVGFITIGLKLCSNRVAQSPSFGRISWCQMADQSYAITKQLEPQEQKQQTEGNNKYWLRRKCSTSVAFRCICWLTSNEVRCTGPDMITISFSTHVFFQTLWDKSATHSTLRLKCERIAKGCDGYKFVQGKDHSSLSLPHHCVMLVVAFDLSDWPDRPCVHVKRAST